MKSWVYWLLLNLCFIIIINYCNCHRHSHGLSCEKQTDSLALYRVILETEWTEDRFPKQYPTTRPNAQFSKLIGRSHNDEYELWSKGGTSSAGFKEFVETGSPNILESRETQGFNGVQDAFIAAPIKTGTGKSEADFFTNHNHSLISLAVRLVPSPDWFIGLDSYDLCRNGTWLKQIRLRLDPYDAGTDQGYTFTSPNWASRPQERIHQITSLHPSKRASSFYYPELENLPAIGYVQFKLLTVFSHEHSVHHVTHWRETEQDESLVAQQRRREELEERLILAGEPIGSSGDESALQDRDSNRGRLANDDSTEQRSIDRTARVPVSRQEINRLLPAKIIKPTPTKQDCQVGDWTSWSPCSKTCGFGAQKRYRRVTQIPRSGRACPNLEQQKWCGSMRKCRTSGSTSLFSWVDSKKANASDEEQ